MYSRYSNYPAFAAHVSPSIPNMWSSPAITSHSAADGHLHSWVPEEPELATYGGSIAELVAQSCIDDSSSDLRSTAVHGGSLKPSSSHTSLGSFIESYGAFGSEGSASPPSVSRSSTLSSRLWSETSSVASLSSLPSPTCSGSPKSVLAGRNNGANGEAWDRMLAEAVEAMGRGTFPTTQNAPAAAAVAAGASPSPNQLPKSHSPNRQQAIPNRNRNSHARNGQRRNMGPGGPVCPTAPQAEAAVAGQTPSGTGVFLPRGSAPGSPASKHPQQQQPQQAKGGRKAQRPGATVYLPPRLVHVLGLNVDANNNVLPAAAGAAPVVNNVASRPSGGAACGRVAPAAPVFKVASEEMLASNNKRGVKGGRSRARAAAAASGPSAAANLPSDWTY
eukprot:TRINITY_DN16773_c1_g1_i1.p1 TRINITY_DN16773_c1_g1~~TRINITY_DN16773_c1_g1_i1.p1  ORF type:complete len:390 (-),score=-18.79 TRINITY_DN16773_c1_g1_i1:125-1294(-)